MRRPPRSAGPSARPQCRPLAGRQSLVEGSRTRARPRSSGSGAHSSSSTASAGSHVTPGATAASRPAGVRPDPAASRLDPRVRPGVRGQRTASCRGVSSTGIGCSSCPGARASSSIGGPAHRAVGRQHLQRRRVDRRVRAGLRVQRRPQPRRVGGRRGSGERRKYPGRPERFPGRNPANLPFRVVGGLCRPAVPDGSHGRRCAPGVRPAAAVRRAPHQQQDERVLVQQRAPPGSRGHPYAGSGPRLRRCTPAPGPRCPAAVRPRRPPRPPPDAAASPGQQRRDAPGRSTAMSRNRSQAPAPSCWSRTSLRWAVPSRSRTIAVIRPGRTETAPTRPCGPVDGPASAAARPARRVLQGLEPGPAPPGRGETPAPVRGAAPRTWRSGPRPPSRDAPAPSAP